jgi:hypothetical protein
MLRPSGLNFTTDAMLHDLLADIQRWKDGLPEHLRFKGPDSHQHAGKSIFVGFRSVPIYMFYFQAFFTLSILVCA